MTICLDPWTAEEIKEAQARAKGHPPDPSVVQVPRTTPSTPWRPPTRRYETKPVDIYGWQNDKCSAMSVLINKRHVVVPPGDWVRTDAVGKPIEVLSAEEWATRYRIPE